MNIVSYNLSDFTERFLVKGSENEKYFKTLRGLQINIGDGDFLPYITKGIRSIPEDDFLVNTTSYVD